MAMNTRRTTDEKIRMVLLWAKIGSYRGVVNQWGEENPPKWETVANVVEKFLKTGSVEDAFRSGRPISATTERNRGLVLQSVLEDPQFTQDTRAEVIGTSQRSVGRMIRAWGFRPYRLQILHQIKPTDYELRLNFCNTFLDGVEMWPGLVDAIWWSDESRFTLGGTINRHNSYYYSDSNPGFFTEVPHTNLGTMVWAAVSSNGIIGPYFFDGSINAESYLTMLTDYFLPNLHELYGDTSDVFFQQDGAPAHSAFIVRDFLDEYFPAAWIGRFGPLLWPPRSPDLTPPDFWLWSYLGERVFAYNIRTVQELQNVIETEMKAIPVEMCQRACRKVVDRCKVCKRRNGGHVELPKKL